MYFSVPPKPPFSKCSRNLKSFLRFILYFEKFGVIRWGGIGRMRLGNLFYIYAHMTFGRSPFLQPSEHLGRPNSFSCKSFNFPNSYCSPARASIIFTRDLQSQPGMMGTQVSPSQDLRDLIFLFGSTRPRFPVLTSDDLRLKAYGRRYAQLSSSLRVSNLDRLRAVGKIPSNHLLLIPNRERRLHLHVYCSFFESQLKNGL